MFDLLMQKCTLNSRNCGFRWNTPPTQRSRRVKKRHPDRGVNFDNIRLNMNIKATNLGTSVWWVCSVPSP